MINVADFPVYARGHVGRFLASLDWKNYSPATVENYGRCLRAVEECLGDPSGWTLEGIAEWAHALKLAPASRAVHFAAVRMFATYARAEGILDLERERLAAMLSVRRKDVYGSRRWRGVDAAGDLEKIVNAIHAAPVRTAVIAELALYAGLRASEIAHLPADAVEIDAEGDVAITVVGKGGKTRIVPILNPRQSVAIRSRIDGARVEGGTFAGLAYRQQVNRALAKLATAAGVKGIYPHRFRHTFCNEFVKKTGNVAALQIVAGHSDANTSAGYLARSTATVKRAMRSAGMLK